MLHHHAHHPAHKQDAIHDSTFFFVGPFDDDEASFFRNNNKKPTNMSLITTNLVSKNSSLTASPISEHSSDEYEYDDDEDYAVLGDDDEPCRDELAPSPRRRHSGAMSISEEDLPFCYDREALRRDTAAHRARQHHHQQQYQPQRGRAGTFAAHEAWDTETDGPSMALWVPDARAGGECKRRRVDKSATVPLPGAARSGAQEKTEEEMVLPQQQHHSSEVDGPMMSLWGV